MVYKKGHEEYIAENLSLDWVRIVDSQQFFKWLEVKKLQKQTYNIKNYNIAFKLEIKHTYR